MKKKSEFEVPGSWFEVDFHVHSPSSIDFQGAGKNEDGYIWLLEQAKLAKLDIIVITDHNDIAGYEKLVEIENDLRRTKKTLERNNSQIPDTVLSQIALYDQILVLPGVELDVYPNLHLIVIFDPQRTDEISNFLNNAGYTKEFRGDEKSSKHGKWSFDDAAQEAEKINAILIAAHVDSNKGLYNISKDWGQNRISAFTNDNLYGMEFTNQVNRDKIENIIKLPDYARNTRLAFVQSSDFHGKPDQKIGDRRTYVRMDNINQQDKLIVFQSLKKALRNPDEFISAPERPELQLILKNLINEPSIENLQNDNDKKLLLQYVCAYANTEDGTIVIGRNAKGNWLGESEKSEQEFTEKINSIIKSGITPLPNIELQVYSYSGSNYIATIRVKKHPQICALNHDDRIYILKENQPSQAPSKEIIDMIESRFIERYSHLSVTNKISDISQKLLGVEDSIDILPLVRKIERNTTSVKIALGEPSLGTIINNENLSEMLGRSEGISGNMIVVETQKPRFFNHYLRVLAPTVTHKDTSTKYFEELQKYSHEKIIIAQGGAVYYDDHQNIPIASDVFPPLIFTKGIENDSINFKFITAYLKSSVAIWYAERCLGSYYDIKEDRYGIKDYFTQIDIFMNLRIPEKAEKTFQDKIENLVDIILDMENEYLKKDKEINEELIFEELGFSEDAFKKLIEIVKDHNRKAGKIAGEIDKLFYNFFDFSIKEIDMIEQFMKSSDFAILSTQTNNDQDNSGKD